ncbi:phage tail protein [Pseudomonas putida]|uniref:phage tail-collar fiber domain-containing protein n=1 Tax=Pseudomonas putida TaxID=303 RepID=UPI001EF8B4A5|nr:phage tail protein [Pseudomonas putida]ULL06029.1 phage tail protein [Pseudomonas putida]
MSTPLQPQITETGLGAIFQKDGTGFSAQITHIAVGTEGYTPSYKQKTLHNQVAKVPIAGGEKLSSTLLHLTALIDGDSAFWVRELGFFLADGTLLAVWSHPTTPLTYKAKNSDLLLAYDVSLAALPEDSVTIVSGEAGLSLSLAEPLAALAAAQISEQLRNLQHQDQTNLQAEKQRIAGEYIANLMSRMKAAEQRQASDYDGLLTAIVTNSTALIGLQHQSIKTILGV